MIKVKVLPKTVTNVKTNKSTTHNVTVNGTGIYFPATDEQIDKSVANYIQDHPSEFKGEAGKDGYTPIKGIDYFDGEKGDRGEQGIQGEKGEKGDRGIPIDVQINGSSVIKNDIANIKLGKGLGFNTSDGMFVKTAVASDITNRSQYTPLGTDMIDEAVESALIIKKKSDVGHTHSIEDISTFAEITLSIIKNSYINNTDGKSISYSGWDETDFIDIENKLIKIYWNTDSAWNAYYDKDKKFISGFNVPAGTTNNLSAPSNAKYIKLSNTVNGINSLTVSESDSIIGIIDKKADKGDSYMKEESDDKYQPKGDYLTEHQSLEKYVQKEAGKGLFSGDYKDLKNKPTIPVVPTSTINANSEARHTHHNKNILDIITQQSIDEWNYSKDFAATISLSGLVFTMTCSGPNLNSLYGVKISELPYEFEMAGNKHLLYYNELYSTIGGLTPELIVFGGLTVLVRIIDNPMTFKPIDFDFQEQSVTLIGIPDYIASNIGMLDKLGPLGLNVVNDIVELTVYMDGFVFNSADGKYTSDDILKAFCKMPDLSLVKGTKFIEFGSDVSFLSIINYISNETIVELIDGDNHLCASLFALVPDGYGGFIGIAWGNAQYMYILSLDGEWTMECNPFAISTSEVYNTSTDDDGYLQAVYTDYNSIESCNDRAFPSMGMIKSLKARMAKNQWVYYGEEYDAQELAGEAMNGTILSLVDMGDLQFAFMSRRDDEYNLVFSNDKYRYSISLIDNSWKKEEISSGVSDEHINGLIDAKLGVIENGTY